MATNDPPIPAPRFPIDRAHINVVDEWSHIEQRCDQIEAQLETLKATVALLLLDNNMPQKAKQVRDL